MEEPPIIIDQPVESNFFRRHLKASTLLATGTLALAAQLAAPNHAAADTAPAPGTTVINPVMTGPNDTTVTYNIESTPMTAGATVKSVIWTFGDGDPRITNNSLSPVQKTYDSHDFTGLIAEVMYSTGEDVEGGAEVFPGEPVEASDLAAKPVYDGQTSSVTVAEILAGATDYDSNDTDGHQLALTKVDQQATDGNCVLDTSNADPSLQTLTFTPADKKAQTETCYVGIKDDAGYSTDETVSFPEVMPPAPAIISSSPQCANPLTRGGAPSHTGVEDISLSNPKLGEDATYHVRLHPQTANDEKNKHFDLQLHDGTSQTASIKGLTYGKYLETVTNKGLQTILNKFVTVKECHVIDPHVSIHKHLDGGVAVLRINNYESWKNVKLTFIDDGHRYHKVISRAYNFLDSENVPFGKHKLTVKLGEKVLDHQMLNHKR